MRQDLDPPAKPRRKCGMGFLCPETHPRRTTQEHGLRARSCKSCAYVIIPEEGSWTTELTSKAQGKGDPVDLIQKGRD